MTRCLRLALIALLSLTGIAAAQEREPLRIEITEGVIEPLPVAIPTFIAETPEAERWAAEITRLVAEDLTGTGLFRTIPPDAFISRPAALDASVQYADWKAINAQALVVGSVGVEGDRLTAKFRLYDVFAEAPLGDGLQFGGDAGSWRRIGHKVADQIYGRITGEGGYFDSRVVLVAESGPKNDRQKRLALMDYDGANLQYLTGGDSIVLAPRFSPDGTRILYTSYATGFPQIYLLDLATMSSRALGELPGTMAFAPRFAPDGRRVVFSLTREGNTDLYELDLQSGERRRLTEAPSIETAPSFSPDGAQIVFESDRSGNQQIYVMPASGGEARRISFGAGRYGTPVWSPRGDLIAFTKQNAGRFHIGVMRTDGSEERLLTASFLDEGPTWAPNGRVVMFARQTSGAGGAPALFSVDVSGRNLRPVPIEGAASDPSWSPLLP
jgi:TolB protein